MYRQYNVDFRCLQGGITRDLSKLWIAEPNHFLSFKESRSAPANSETPICFAVLGFVFAQIACNYEPVLFLIDE